MRYGFRGPREDLYDDRHGQPIPTRWGVSSTPSSAVGTAMNDEFNTLLRAPSAPPAPSYELPAEQRAKFDELVEQLQGQLVVTVDGLRQDEGTILLFLGHTQDEDVLFAVEHRAAAWLLDAVAQLDDDVEVEIEAWQVLSRSAR